jgi:menaquinol-cytochrome c reductase iron-sulfur subunit
MTHEKDSPPSAGAPSPPDSDESAHAQLPPPTAHEIARRQLLGKMSVGVGVLCGAAISAPGIGFVVAPLFRDDPREWRSLGKVDQFKVGETLNVVFIDASPLPWAGVTSKTSAWLRRVAEGEFIAFSVNCAHLGCPVYYEDGRVAAGPPPHPLTRYPVRVNGDQVEIRTDPIPIG